MYIKNTDCKSFCLKDTTLGYKTKYFSVKYIVNTLNSMQYIFSVDEFNFNLVNTYKFLIEGKSNKININVNLYPKA